VTLVTPATAESIHSQGIEGQSRTSPTEQMHHVRVVRISMEQNALRFEQTRAEDVCVLSLAGRIDSQTANDLKAKLTRMISSGERSVLVDFKSVAYLTSAGFHALLLATDVAQRNAAKLVLCNVVGLVRETFESAGLAALFTIAGSREEALIGMALRPATAENATPARSARRPT
jgi:anti-sigma B factor antagonist